MSPTQTKQWLTAFLGATTAGFVNHGAVSGCPQSGGGVNQNGSCNGGWTQADYYALSGGMSSTRIQVLPQIYYSQNAEQWELIDLYGTSNSMPKLNFAGPLSENRANLEDSGSNDNLTPTDAWNDLWNDLRSDSRTTVDTLPYSTDLFDDGQTTSPPAI